MGRWFWAFHTDPHYCVVERTHAIAEVNQPERQSLTCDLALDPGTTRPGTVAGPDAKPLAGCVAIELCTTSPPARVTRSSASSRAGWREPGEMPTSVMCGPAR